MTIINQETYLNAQGLCCPFCFFDRIYTHSELEGNGTTVWQTVKCPNCSKQWLDVYKLIGFEELEGSNEHES